RPWGPLSGPPTRTRPGPPPAPPPPARGRLGGRAQCLLSIPRDRLLETLVQVDLRLEAEHLARLLDVRDPQLDIGVVERLEGDVDVGPRQPADPQREVVDRDRGARV